MTYSAFLALFLLVPVLVTAAFTRIFHGWGKRIPSSLRAWPAMPVLAGHAALAVLYTAPWDNYLVATQVWWYDPALVSGLVIGYVPLEEYLFFIAQTVLVGLWTLLAARLTRREGRKLQPRPFLRLWSTLLACMTGAFGAYLLANRQFAGNYSRPGAGLGLRPDSNSIQFRGRHSLALPLAHRLDADSGRSLPFNYRRPGNSRRHLDNKPTAIVRYALGGHTACRRNALLFADNCHGHLWSDIDAVTVQS